MKQSNIRCPAYFCSGIVFIGVNEENRAPALRPFKYICHCRNESPKPGTAGSHSGIVFPFSFSETLNPGEQSHANTAQANKTNSQIPELKFPVPSGALSSGFGYRRGIFHTGLDIKAPQGEDVLACADGEVVLAGTRKGYRSYGRTVLIDHGKDVFTLYAHLSSIHVAAGQKVRRGQKIACVGCTGRATAPHLHLEVRMGDRAFDPYVCFSKSELRRIEVAKGFGNSPLGPVRVRRLSARR